MKNTNLNRYLAGTLAGLGLLGTPPAHALGWNTTAAGTGFASSCAGLVAYLDPATIGGALNNGVSDSQRNCDISPPGPPAQANVGSSKQGISNNVAYQASAQGMAAPQIIQLQASQQGSSNTQFDGAYVNGGWNDHLTLSAPGQSGQALWVIPLNVSGQINVSGVAGRAYVQLTAYRNNSVLQPYGSQLNADAWAWFNSHNTPDNGALGGGRDFQMVQWQVLDNGPGTFNQVPSLTASGQVQFVMPFTWGQGFDLGVYALGAASHSAQGGYPNTVDTSALDFGPGAGITWAGPGMVISGGQQITQFDIAAASGINYNQPYAGVVPEPDKAVLWLLGLGAVVGRWARAAKTIPATADPARKRAAQGAENHG